MPVRNNQASGGRRPSLNATSISNNNTSPQTPVQVPSRPATWNLKAAEEENKRKRDAVIAGLPDGLDLRSGGATYIRNSTSIFAQVSRTRPTGVSATEIIVPLNKFEQALYARPLPEVSKAYVTNDYARARSNVTDPRSFHVQNSQVEGAPSSLSSSSSSSAPAQPESFLAKFMKFDRKAPEMDDDNDTANLLKYIYEQNQLFHKTTLITLAAIRVSISTPCCFFELA